MIVWESERLSKPAARDLMRQAERKWIASPATNDPSSNTDLLRGRIELLSDSYHLLEQCLRLEENAEVHLRLAEVAEELYHLGVGDSDTVLLHYAQAFDQAPSRAEIRAQYAFAGADFDRWDCVQRALHDWDWREELRRASWVRCKLVELELTRTIGLGENQNVAHLLNELLRAYDAMLRDGRPQDIPPPYQLVAALNQNPVNEGLLAFLEAEVSARRAVHGGRFGTEWEELFHGGNDG